MVQPWTDFHGLLQAQSLDCFENWAMQQCCLQILFSAAAPPVLPVLAWVSQNSSDTEDFTLAFCPRQIILFPAEITIQCESKQSSEYIWRRKKLSSHSSHSVKLVNKNGRKPLPNLCVCIFGFVNNRRFYCGTHLHTKLNNVTFHWL